MRRESLVDEKYKGEDYQVNKELKNGPLANRRCTDFLFTVIFLAFIGLLGYITSGAIQNEKIDELISPVDQDQKLCGVDYGAYPYLYYVL